MAAGSSRAFTSSSSPLQALSMAALCVYRLQAHIKGVRCSHDVKTTPRAAGRQGHRKVGGERNAEPLLG